MKYAIFSDIHGNSHAFQTMLAQCLNQHVEGYLFCGDIMGYYYDSEEIFAAMATLPNLYAVRGNHDQLALDIAKGKADKEALAEKYSSAYIRPLSPSLQTYLEALPLAQILQIEGKLVYLAHGSPGDPLNGRIYPDTLLPKDWAVETDFVFLGHTHYQMERSKKETRIFNPGSLGQPRDGKGFAYATVDFSTGELERHTVSFPLVPLLEEIALWDPDKPYLREVLLRKAKGKL